MIFSNDIKVARLRNISNRNTIIFFQLFFMYVASLLHLEHAPKKVSIVKLNIFIIILF